MNEHRNALLPYLVAVNLTKRCNLACAHCYMDADRRMAPNPDELKSGELKSLFKQIAGRAPGTIIVLTGGEPLLRPDLPELVSEGADAGLRMVLGTNGLMLTSDRVAELKGRGLQGAGISLDSTHPAGHDSFRGLPGAFEKTVAGIKACREQGIHVQVHFSVVRHNLGEIEGIVDLAQELGAAIVNFFFLVCVGRGERALDLDPETYEVTLRKIARIQRERKGIMVQSRCTPHFKRILYEEDPASQFTRAEGYDGGGCPAATHYCRIDPQGEMTPCPYMELSGGNIRHRGFWEIWDDAPLFQSFRKPELLQGKCGACEFKTMCGGCRARALAQTGNLMAEDPNCLYEPKGGPLIESRLEPGSEEAVWTPAARERLGKMPLFIRTMVKRRLEKRAKLEGVPITPELMQRHREEREAELGIKFREEKITPALTEAWRKS